MPFNDSRTKHRLDRLHDAIRNRDQEVSRACQRGDCKTARKVFENYEDLINFFKDDNTGDVQLMPGQQANGELAAPFGASPLQGLHIDPAKKTTPPEKEKNL